MKNSDKRYSSNYVESYDRNNEGPHRRNSTSAIELKYISGNITGSDLKNTDQNSDIDISLEDRGKRNNKIYKKKKFPCNLATFMQVHDFETNPKKKGNPFISLVGELFV